MEYSDERIEQLTYINIYTREGGTKASSRQTSVSFSGGRRGTRHMVGSLRVSGAADARGGICNDNGDGGSREASRAALG